MISRRRFFTIMVIFAAVFVLFQGLQVARTLVIDLHSNPHVRMREDGVYVARSISESETTLDEALGADEPYVLYVGGDGEAAALTTMEWCFYAGFHTVFASEAPEPDLARLPEFVVVSAGSLAQSVDVLEGYVEHGVCVICAGLPDVRVVAPDMRLREFLAISEVHAAEVELKGHHLFGGFLVGGERIFVEEEGVEPGKERQDLELVLPWYVVRQRTRTFMRGILTDADAATADAAGLENEDLPAIWWCARTESGGVYVIADDSFEDRQVGLGIITAALSDDRPVTAYPVVNAQVLSLLDFPLLSDENNDVMVATYGRPVTLFDSDIVMPQLSSLSSRYHFRPSCFMSPEYDYSDPSRPSVDALVDVLGMVYDVEGEVGMSSSHTGGITTAQKQEADAEFMAGSGSDYAINALQVDASELDYALSVIGPGTFWDDISTITISQDLERPLVGYVNDSVTMQQATQDALEHSFRDELELMGLETALGYENVTLDMSRVYHPQDVEDEWQNVSHTAFSNITTYNEPYSALGRVTVSEADERIRDFFDVDVEVSYEGDVVRITHEADDDSLWLVLRTHDQEVEGVRGGTVTQIEDGCYLVESTRPETVVTLTDSIRDVVFPRVGV